MLKREKTKHSRRKPVAAIQLWRVRAWLKRKGLFAAIDAEIESEKDAKPAIWEAWNHGYILSRGDKLAKKLKLSDAQLDALFTKSAKAD